MTVLKHTLDRELSVELKPPVLQFDVVPGRRLCCRQVKSPLPPRAEEGC
jgi:hypothetical protein